MMRLSLALALTMAVSPLSGTAQSSPAPAPSAAHTASSPPFDASAAAARAALLLAKTRVETMLRTQHADAAWFAPSFLAQINVAQLNGILSNLRDQDGEFKGLDISPSRFVAHFARGNDVLVFVHLDASDLIDGLLFRPAASQSESQPAAGDTPVAIDAAGVSLHGSELVPANVPKPALAILVAGSGPIDRNGPDGIYRQLATSLAKRGIASFRYDKRGIGESTIDPATARAVTIDDFANDLAAVARHYAADRRFSRVVAVGHSEGSLLGILAAQRAEFSGFVSLEGVGRPLDVVLHEQLRAALSSRELAQADLLIASLKAGRIVPDVSGNLALIFPAAVQPFFISEMRYNAAREMAKVRIPALIVQGTTDLQVTVADAEQLHRANSHASYVLIRGMNHILRDAPIDRAANIATYSNHAPISTTLVRDLVAFITK